MGFKLPGLAGNKTAQQIGAIGAGFALGGPAGAAAAYSAVSASQANEDAINAQRDANQQNIEFQQATNAQSVELANTAHQREVRDLRAAGLNPILSAGGSGAVTPNLKAATVESLAPVIAGNASRMQNQQALTLQAAQTVSSIRQQNTQAQLNSASAVKASEEARRVALENEALKEDAKKRQFEDEYRNRRPNKVKEFGIDIRDAVDAINPFKGWFK